ncbi:MAG: molybdopterin oxidoreductase family protein [Oceanococcaceae bacterium]
MTTTHFRACNLCEALCGLAITVDADAIVSIKPDKADPFSRGHICPKGVALQDLQTDPDRLRQPLRRTAAGWEEISWDAAFDLVASRLAAITAEHGDDAVGVYFGNPNVHNYGSLTHASTFLGHIKTRNRFSATSVDQLPHQLAALKLYGHQLMVPIPDIDRTQYFLALGYNPMASNGSLMTVPDFPNRLKALQARGGKLVVIDPRRSETAQVADEYHAIRPTQDAAFLLALIHVLFAEGRVAALPDYVVGADAVREAVAAFPPERVAPACGIAADDIRRIAREFAAAESAVCHARMGCSTQVFGGLCLWAANVLNVLSGNLDRPGAAMFTQPAVDMVESPSSKPGAFGRWHSRVSGLPEFSGELPTVCMGEEMATPGPGQIRALVTSAGNPVLSTPDGRALEQRLETLDFMVSIDFYLNETTRYADVVLPPTTTLEHDHYDLIFNSFAVRNVTRYNEPVLPKPEGSYHDWEIFQQLGARYAALTGRSPRPMPRPEQIIDMGLQTGRYGRAAGHPAALSLAALKAQPHGVDLGPLQPCLPARLRTANKQVDLADAFYLDDIRRVDARLSPPEAAEGELLLIGRRHVRSNNSWMHNAHRLVKGKARDQLLMHPDDMRSRGLADGARVAVSSRIGTVQVAVVASAEMMPGVVSLPHGWGHDRKGVRLDIAARYPGVSANDLTDTRLLDPLSGNAAVNGVPVQVKAA